MKTPKRASRNEKVDPWSIARYLAESILPPDPDVRKHVFGSLRARDLNTVTGLGELLDQEYQDPHVNGILAQRQVASLFKKNEAFSLSTCETTARDSFLKAESKCRITNRRLDHFFFHSDRVDPDVKRWIRRMQYDISVLLGDVDAKVYHAMGRYLRLTPGATEDRTRRRSLPFLKITGKLRAPSKTKPYLRSALSFMGIGWDEVRFIPTEQNSVVMVPKNWKTHRTIAKEPTHSLPFQLALDSILKRRLKKWGIDLSSQKRNQELAREGSIDGSLATIDLAMASDTLSFNAVALLLPYKWFELFNSFRSCRYKAPWGEGEYAKFSSMGNGYTFTLETLIFGAAVRAIGSRRNSVYGDDIIVESERASDLIKLLSFLGFTVNKEKSYVNPDSRFRESCGCDYYKGRLVTPFYMRETPYLEDRSSLCHLVNCLIAISSPGPLWDWCKKIVVGRKLRLVPFNEDTRSGIHIPVYDAYRLRKVYVCRTRGSRKPNILFGLQVFKGYGQTQRVRQVRGWRSLLLWHISAYGSEGFATNLEPKRLAAKLLSSSVLSASTDIRQNVVSKVVVRSTYVHCERRYSPPALTAPLSLFLWGDEW